MLAEDGQKCGFGMPRNGVVVPLVDPRKDVIIFLTDADDLEDFIREEVGETETFKHAALVHGVHS
jgi:hypothetical protein